jgi:tetratricopeptide (TPR) repeat protein
VIINANLGYVYILARRYPEAIAQLQKALELDPSFGITHRSLGQALELNGQLEQAITEYEKGYRFGNDDHALAYVAHAYALKGDREKALQLLTQLKELEQRGTVWAFGFALVYLGLGDKNEAINWLERSYREKEAAKISLIKVEPMLDPLRGDPRFEKLANQIVPADVK